MKRWLIALLAAAALTGFPGAAATTPPPFGVVWVSRTIICHWPNGRSDLVQCRVMQSATYSSREGCHRIEALALGLVIRELEARGSSGRATTRCTREIEV